MTTARLSPISTLLAAVALAVGYGLSRWIESLLIVGLGLLWLFGQRRGWGGLASPILMAFVGAAVFGIWSGAASLLMLIGMVAALSAWDLDHLARRLRSVKDGENVHAVERGHLRRLLIVDGLSLLLGAVALGSQVRLGLGAVFLLGLLAILGLSGAINFLRRESD